MNETELDKYIDDIDELHDEESDKYSYETQYLLGLCDSSGTPITTDNNW